MNAYELADQVQMWGEDLLALNMKGGIPVTKGAELIRQQADRIAKLESYLEAYKTRVADLEKSSMAWYEAGKFVSPQMKELSDEEIKEIFEKNWLDLKDYKEFARLILKKASEK